jgi:hypothetical protein
MKHIQFNDNAVIKEKRMLARKMDLGEEQIALETERVSFINTDTGGSKHFKQLLNVFGARQGQMSYHVAEEFGSNKGALKECSCKNIYMYFQIDFLSILIKPLRG